jgi:hypothetical protein
MVMVAIVRNKALEEVVFNKHEHLKGKIPKEGQEEEKFK